MYPNNDTPWSNSDIDYLTKFYAKLPVSVIAEQLGRSEKATRGKIERLNLKLAPLERNPRGHKWTIEEDELLKSNYRKSSNELKQLLPRRTFRAIQARLHIMKLYRRWETTGYKSITGWVSYAWGNGRHKTYMHRNIAELKLGRKLLPTERVHHINCDKKDNRGENLYLYPDSSAHTRAHQSLNKIVKPLMERGIIKFNLDTGRYEIVN